MAIALAVRAQVDNYAWQIDQSARRFAPWLAGSRYFGDLPLRGEEADINCIELTGAYDYVAARATLTLPTTMAGPYQLYADGVSLFLTNAEGVYLNCHQFMANPNVDVIIPHGEWQNARTQAGQARDMLTQAIIAAGGTP